MIKNQFFKLYFTALISIINAGDLLPPDNLKNLEILNEGNIWIGWKHADTFDWCQAKTTLDAPIADIQKIIENKANYPNVFKRVESAIIITDEIVYIALDMPFPFAGRDYVVKYIQEQKGDEFFYRFHAVIHPKAPSKSKYVRLINSAGEWRLKSLDSNQTEITYTWNGELLGDFPNWALTRAWKQQGLEVMTWLKEAIKK